MEYTMHNQTFGLELEFGGISRQRAIDTVKGVLGPSRYNYGNEMYDSKDRKWKIVRDGSINESLGGDKNELVTPPLKYEDMELLQNVVRALRRAGAKIDSSCGIHIHVGLEPYTAKSLKNLIKFYGKYENMFYKAVNVHSNRQNNYTKKFTQYHSDLFEQANSIKTVDDIKKMWYHRFDSDPTCHYDNSRYCGLNLHNIWYKGWYSGTVEFRFFNATLHAGEIRSYVTLILAMSAKALNAKTINMRQANLINDEHLFPKVLGGMGILARDPEMKNVYKHLMKNMEREWASA